MSNISNMNFSYQEYKAYQQTHKDCGIGGRTPYSMIGNDPETDNKKKPEGTVISESSLNADFKMTAEYADDFSQDMPLIKVTIGNAEEKQEYFINIDEIDPRDASVIEMFALFGYADAHEKNMGFSSSLWDTLSGYVQSNTSYTDMNHVELIDKSYKQKSDWIAMVEETRNEYMVSGLYKQVADGNKLICLFEQYGMPDTVEMSYMDADHWIPASNYTSQIATDCEWAVIEIDGNGELRYINFMDEEAGWSMKITQEQLAKAMALGDEFAMYISDKSFWDNYLNSDISLDKLKDITEKINQKSTYTDFFDKLPDDVKAAWQKAGEEAGINAFGIDDEGKLLYLSEFARNYLFASMQNKSEDFFRKIAEDMAKFAKKVLTDLESVFPDRYNTDTQKFKDSEKIFYQQLLSYLEDQRS